MPLIVILCMFVLFQYCHNYEFHLQHCAAFVSKLGSSALVFGVGIAHANAGNPKLPSSSHSHIKVISG